MFYRRFSGQVNLPARKEKLSLSAAVISPALRSVSMILDPFDRGRRSLDLFSMSSCGCFVKGKMGIFSHEWGLQLLRCLQSVQLR